MVRAGCHTRRHPAQRGPKHASGRGTFCHTRQGASAQVRPQELRRHVAGSRFLEVDPVEGGSANDYDYCSADAIGCLDLTGESEGLIARPFPCMSALNRINCTLEEIKEKVSAANEVQRTSHLMREKRTW
jgi:hypothetical protein